MEPGTVDTGEDSETDQASQTAAAEGVAADTGSLFEDYPSLVPPTDDDDAAVAVDGEGVVDTAMPPRAQPTADAAKCAGAI